MEIFFVFKLGIKLKVIFLIFDGDSLELWYNAILLLLTGNLKNALVEVDALAIWYYFKIWALFISLFLFILLFINPYSYILKIVLLIYAIFLQPQHQWLGNDDFSWILCCCKVSYLVPFFTSTQFLDWIYHLFLLIHHSVRVSNELGKGDPRAAKFAIINIFVTSLTIGLVLFTLFLIFRTRLAYIFTEHQYVAAEVNHLSPLLAFSILMNSIQPVLSGEWSLFLPRPSSSSHYYFA